MPLAPLPYEIYLILACDRPRMIGHQQTRNGAALTNNHEKIAPDGATPRQKRAEELPNQCPAVPSAYMRAAAAAGYL